MLNKSESHDLRLTRCSKLDFLWKLHPAESFPLVLGFFLLIQQTSFVVIQAKALYKIFVPNCRASSQIVFTRKYIHAERWSNTDI